MLIKVSSYWQAAATAAYGRNGVGVDVIALLAEHGGQTVGRSDRESHVFTTSAKPTSSYGRRGYVRLRGYRPAGCCLTSLVTRL